MSTLTTTAATATALAEYVARTEGLDYLGQIVCHEVPAGFTDRITLEAALSTAGLSAFMPKKSAVTDTFRKVMSSMNGTVEQLDDGNRARLLTVRLDNAGEVLQQQLVVELVDPDGKKLDDRTSYFPAYAVSFDRATERIDITPLDAMDAWSSTPADVRRIAGDAAGTITASYRRRDGLVDQDGIRGMVNKVLADAKSVTIRAGADFVLGDRSDRVAKLVAADRELRRTSPHRPMTIQAFGLVDEDGDQRQMVLDAVSAETLALCDSLLAEARSVDTISDRRRASLLARQGAVLAKLREFEGNLGQRLDEARTRIEFTEMQMRRLF